MAVHYVTAALWKWFDLRHLKATFNPNKQTDLKNCTDREDGGDDGEGKESLLVLNVHVQQRDVQLLILVQLILSVHVRPPQKPGPD